MTTSQLWSALKRKLIAELGREGAAEWLAFSAAVLRQEARREPIDAKALRITEFRP